MKCFDAEKQKQVTNFFILDITENKNCLKGFSFRYIYFSGRFAEFTYPL